MAHWKMVELLCSYTAQDWVNMPENAGWIGALGPLPCRIPALYDVWQNRFKS